MQPPRSPLPIGQQGKPHPSRREAEARPQGLIRKGVLHREKTPSIWVPLPGSAKEQSGVPSAGDNEGVSGSIDPERL